MMEDIELVQLKKLLSHLKEKFQYDFSDYTMSSFKRRVMRILELHGFDTVEALIKRLDSDKFFIDTVVKAITVNTTEMFRDPSFWRKLRDEIIPDLKTVNKIRIWHAACSSGEEVYSMCILLKELELLEKAEIVAIDLNEDVLSTAKKGVYFYRNMELNESNYQKFEGKKKLSEYYTQINPEQVQFDPRLIENVTFHKYDLVRSLPISKFDLIICRNVMIYFNIDLQSRVVDLFDVSLFKGGYLAVGSKETIAWCKAAKNFSTICAEEKIFKKLVA
jgi:chemotaxis protein methyltransferase CheR